MENKIGVNNIFKLFSNFKKRIEVSYDKYSPLLNYNSYNTNYDIVDKNGNITFSQRAMTCFTDFTESFKYNHENSLVKFGKGSKMYLYALSKDTLLSEEEIKRYLKEIKKLGFAFKLHIKEDYDLSYMPFKRDGTTGFFTQPSQRSYHLTKEEITLIDKEYYGKDIYTLDTENFPLLCFARQKVYILEIDLNVHKSMATLKPLLYFFRWIYEFDFPVAVKKALEYKSRFPNTDFIECLNLMEYYLTSSKRESCYYLGGRYNTPKYLTGHRIFGYLRGRIINKLYKEQVRKEEKRELEKGYTNDTNENIFKNFRQIRIQIKNKYGGTGNYAIDEFQINEKESITNFFKRLFNEKSLSNLMKLAKDDPKSWSNIDFKVCEYERY